MSLGLNVRATESLVAGLLHPEGKAKAEKASKIIDPNVREAQDQLRQRLGLKVTVEDRKGKGRVIIEYASSPQLQSLSLPLRKALQGCGS